MVLPIDWLLKVDPWVIYRARLDLLGESDTNPGVLQARAAMLADTRVQGLLAELSGWPVERLNSHKSAGHPLHKLVFLADLGLKANDPGMSTIIERVMEHQADTGLFQVLMNISPHYGGSGEDVWAWAPCDAPLILYALIQFGLGDDKLVRKGVDYLVSLCFENGWRCTTSPELGKFRGPGKKDDPCPFANLIMLKTLVPCCRSIPTARLRTPGRRHSCAVGQSAAISIPICSTWARISVSSRRHWFGTTF